MSAFIALLTNAPCFEVVVVNDGSTKLLGLSVSTQPFFHLITLIRQPHTGIPSARNLEASTSKAQGHGSSPLTVRTAFAKGERNIWESWSCPRLVA